MRSAPSLSVIIPNYKRTMALYRAIESVVRHDAEAEVVVVDDGSPNYDEIENGIAARFDARVRLVPLPAKGNAAVARNHGARLARGDWILLLDSDDEFLPAKCGVLREYLSRVGAGVVIHRSIVRVDGRDAGVVPVRGLHPGESIAEFLFCAKELLPTPAMCVRRQVLLDNPFDERYTRHQDFDFLLGCVQGGVEVQLMPDVLAVIHWTTDTSVAEKGESAQYSLWWALEQRPRMPDRAFRAFLQRFVVLKSLRFGNRRLGWSTARRFRLRLSPSELALAIALTLSTRRLRAKGYLWWKARQSRMLQRRRGST